MNGNYIAGVGIVNDDFSITNKDLASFDDLQNAKLFLQAKYDNTFNKLIYLDVKGEGRYLYDGKELYIPGDNTKLMMSGYNVSADYYDEGIDGKEEWNHSQNSVVMTREKAERLEDELKSDGYVNVKTEYEEFDLRKQSWDIEKFLIGLRPEIKIVYDHKYVKICNERGKALNHISECCGDDVPSVKALILSACDYTDEAHGKIIRENIEQLTEEYEKKLIEQSKEHDLTRGL